MQRNTPAFETLWFDGLSRAAEASRTAQAGIPWLWHGFLAPGNVTLLTGQWKCGKTTLLAALLSRLGPGGQLAGLAVTPGKAAVVTEEGPELWQRRSDQFAFGPHLAWICRPFQAKPDPGQWLALIDHLGSLRQAHGIQLAVIDALASFLPGGENHAGQMLECLLPLQRLVGQGMALLVLHHPRKQAASPGRLARGSGALSGYVDILIEMDWHAGPTEPDRRRRLQALSRHAETPRQLVIELNAGGNDFVALGNLADVEFEERWQRLREVLAAAPRKLTRRALLARWPLDLPKIDPATLWRWLDRAVTQGLLRRAGAGRRNDPYRFWLPERDEELAEDMESFFKRLLKDKEQTLPPHNSPGEPAA